MFVRYSVSAIFGLASALLLLWLMQHLIAGQGSRRLDEGGSIPVFDFVRIKERPELHLRQRQLPAPPEQPKSLPRPQVALQQPELRPVTPSLKLTLPLTLAADIGGVPYLGPVGKGERDREFMALSRMPPQYPYQARRQKIEGWVKVAFTVTESGTVESVEVLASEPSGVFERAATRAIYKWTFKPRIVAGSPVASRAIQTLEFRLNQ